MMASPGQAATFVYVGNAESNEIYVLDLDLNIDSSGRYLLAVGQLSHGMSSYAIDPATGKLTKLKEYPMGKNPNWVEIVDLP